MAGGRDPTPWALDSAGVRESVIGGVGKRGGVTVSQIGERKMRERGDRKMREIGDRTMRTHARARDSRASDIHIHIFTKVTYTCTSIDVRWAGGGTDGLITSESVMSFFHGLKLVYIRV